MKTKNLYLVFASVMTLMLLASFTSALTVTAPKLDRDSNSVQITLFSDVSETVEFTGLQPIEQDGRTITFTPLSSTTLTANTPKIITLNYIVHSDFEFLLGNTYSTQLITTGTESGEVTQTLEFESSDYCEFGDQGSWIRIRGLSDKKLDNKNEWKWKPLDNVRIVVEIQNDRSDDEISGVVEYGIYDTEENEFIFEDDFDFEIDEDDREEFEIEFQLDPADLNSGTNSKSYIFYIKVYEDYDAEERTQCKQLSRDLEIIQNRDEVVLDINTLNFVPSEIMCGSQVTLTGEVFNIGSRDQDDVTVRIYNQELGININLNVGDLDAGESKRISALMDIPADAAEKIHSLEISIFDKKGGYFEIKNSRGDKSDSRYVRSFSIQPGTCRPTIPDLQIIPTLESGGVAGRNMVVKALVSNTGADGTFTVTAKGFEDWATLSSVSPQTVIIREGETNEVLINLRVNKDAIGEKSFDLEFNYGGSSDVISQPVSVEIEKSGFSLPSFELGGSWYIWVIGIINVILVVVIIIVAIRVVRSK